MTTISDFKATLDVYSDDTVIAYMIFSAPDVVYRAKDRGIKLTIDQAKDILIQIQKNRDANLGINWDVIDYYLDEIGE